MPKIKGNMNVVSVAEAGRNGSDATEEVIVRFSNNHLPQRASRNKNNLAAVCCPAYSLD